MHDIEEEPLGWLKEFVIGLGALFLTQLLCGVITFWAIRSRLSHRHKLLSTLVLISILSCLSYHIFDSKTHVIGAISGAVAMLFTTPLHAVASIEKSAAQKHDIPAKEIILRVAIPAALPSLRYPNEEPNIQAIRGSLHLAFASSIRGAFEASIEAGGVVADAMAVLFMIGGAAGALNLMSAVLGLLGIRSPMPFRDPLLSTSLARFWGGRWNAPVSDALRVGLYEPLVRRGVNKGLATMACFICSGIAHEMILLYCGIAGSNGEWFAFFVIAGLMTVVESVIERFIPERGKWLFCFFSIYIPFHFLFVPLTLRTGLASAGVEAIATGKVLMGSLWQYLTTNT